MRSRLVIIIGSILITFASVYAVYFTGEFYKSVFRLSFEQISDRLAGAIPQCKKVDECKLLPGDILIRRYITERTWLIDKLANPYFTHSAFYIGDGKLVESVGTEKNPADDIQISILSKSDWANSDLNNFVVIRPKNYRGKLDKIISNLKSIAEDPDYSFGLPKPGFKRATCSSLIFDQSVEGSIVQNTGTSKIVTPDYLFWLTASYPDEFNVIGFNLVKQK